MECLLVCSECKKEFSYLENEFICKGCGERIVDSEVKNLVVALNNYGIKTEKSCQGHSGYGYDNYYDFPWVTITDEKDLEKLRSIIKRYNNAYCLKGDIFSPWKIIFDISGLKYRLFPENIYKDTESLQEESKILAKFISNLKQGGS